MKLHMIVSQRQINSLTSELQTLILTKEAAVKDAISTFNSWKDIASHLKILLSSLTRVKAMILSDEKELNDLKAKCKDFSMLSRIDTNDPGAEKWAVRLVEIEAIIGNSTLGPTGSLIELIQENLGKLKQILNSRDEISLTKRKEGTQQKVAVAGSSLGRVSDRAVAERRKYSDSKGIHRKYFEFHNEALINQITNPKKPTERKLDKNTPESKEHAKCLNRDNLQLARNELGRQSNRREDGKECKRNVHKERVWQIGCEKDTPSNVRGQCAKALKFTSSSHAINERYRKNSTDQNAALMHLIPSTKRISNKNLDAQKAKIISLTNFNFNSRPVMEALNILAEESKSCCMCGEECHSSTVLKCCGRVCLKCIRRKLLETEPRVVLNAFEAERKQTSMCICPTHQMTINTEQLLSIFTNKELERISIEALKRERKNRKNDIRNINNPSLCIDCKEVIEDTLNTIKVCSKHKLCRGCYQ
eukprot:TRINITY_DN2091_c0_g3_i1.p1 TRINITY_DN2091_c0_g3~~TRINITY_DN2091_c0_g3_i1.p1  ORF type:complete len:476 (+),score=137.58 TRINITY_DN2091_c0_g3_i1:97-1524(+)